MNSRSQMIKNAIDVDKRASKERVSTKKHLKAFLELLPAFNETGLTPKGLKDLWYGSEDPLADIAHLYPGSGLDLIRVYTGAAIGASDLFKRDFLQKTVGKYFLTAMRALGGQAIVAFTMKGHKKPWIITNAQLPDTLALVPRVIIPSTNTSRHIQLMSADLLVEDLTDV